MIDEQVLATLGSIIKKNIDNQDYKIFIFGSRTQKKHRQFCDIDIGILGVDELPSETLLQIKEELHSSDIPYMTEVVDFRTVSESFKKKALSHIINL